MSRTIRRKNLCPFMTGDVYREDDARWTQVFEPGLNYRQYVKMALAKFYRSKNIFGTKYSIPRFIGKMKHERPQRREICAQLHRAQRYDEWDGLSIHRWPKDWTLYY